MRYLVEESRARGEIASLRSGESPGPATVSTPTGPPPSTPGGWGTVT